MTPVNVDPDPKLVAAFREWWRSGSDEDRHALILRLQEHRGKRFRIGDVVFHLTKLSDRNDDVIVCWTIEEIEVKS